MADYFYARVSTLDQNLDRQLAAANGCGIPSKNVFAEKLSGKDIKRPELGRLIRVVQLDDVVIRVPVFHPVLIVIIAVGQHFQFLKICLALIVEKIRLIKQIFIGNICFMIIMLRFIG